MVGITYFFTVVGLMFAMSTHWLAGGIFLGIAALFCSFIPIKAVEKEK